MRKSVGQASAGWLVGIIALYKRGILHQCNNADDSNLRRPMWIS